MSPRIWCMLLFTLTGEVQTQAEDQVVFLLGTFQNVSFSQNETVQATVLGIPSAVTYITLQFHTQHQNTTLSFSRTAGVSLTAVDVGLLSHLAPGQTSLSLFLTTPDGGPTAGTGVLLPYANTDPVPGSCNMQLNLDIDPNIYLHYNLYETTLRFAPANVGHARGASPPPCNGSEGTGVHHRLLYDVYQYFIPEGDLSEQSLFASLQRVADVQGMRENGDLVMTLSWENVSMAVVSSVPGWGAVVSSVPGWGAIYSVIVRDPALNTFASYVPAHTYACSFASTLDGCISTGKVSTKVFFTVVGLAGFFVCFFGHRFFKCEMFCMGFSFTAFVFFLLITGTTTLSYDIRLALTAVMGAVGGVMLVTSWWRFGSVMACVLVVGLILGFLVASTLFFTPLGDIEVFKRSDLAFWINYCCVLVIVTLFFVRWPREGNIATCGVAGAYCVVLMFSTYVSTTLNYITLNVIKRMLNSNFSTTLTDVPLHSIDFVLITVWVVLGVSGVVIQLYRERSRAFFPPSPYLMWRQECERRKTNVLDPSHHVPTLPARLLARVRQLTNQREPSEEQTPLLL